MEIVLLAGLGFAGGVVGCLLVGLMRRFVRGGAVRRGIDGSFDRFSGIFPSGGDVFVGSGIPVRNTGSLGSVEVSSSEEGGGRRGEQTRRLSVWPSRRVFHRRRLRAGSLEMPG